MQKIGVVCNKNKDHSIQLAKEISQYLKEKGYDTVDNISDSIDAIVDSAHMIIALGGDGTILNLAHHLVGKYTPVMGVNLGNLGFITDIKEEEVYREIDVFLNGTHKIEERFMLSVTVSDQKGRQPKTYTALNDVVIHREGVSRYLNITLRVNGNIIYSVGGDGILVATPTGSTGYNLSAGGPIVHATAETMIVTPICHHSLIQKAIVLSEHDAVELTISSKKDPVSALISIDGQISFEISDMQDITVCGSDARFHIIRNSQRNYFNVLKEKFGWHI